MELQKINKVYCSFKIAETELSFAVDYVKEVVNFPSQIIPMPLAQDYLVGLFNLRGMIVPVVDLQSLLNIESKPSVSFEKKVAIIEVRQNLIGVLVDKASEVFKPAEEELCYFADTESRLLISGAFKLDQGKRIVQLLNPEVLFKLENVPINKAAISENKYKKIQIEKKKKRQCISFTCGASACAIDISSIQEIIMLPTINTTTFVSENCLGTIELRGHLIPILPMTKMLGGKDEAKSDNDRRILVLTIDNFIFGFLVDQVHSLITYSEDELIDFPVLSKSKKDIFLGCILKEHETDLILLNTQNLLESDDIEIFTKGRSNLFKSKLSVGKKKPIEKTTYVTFHLGQLAAIEIKEIKEIINYTDDFVIPPDLDKNFLGVLNLRGHMVTLVNTSKIRSTGSSPKDANKRKILIFSHQNVLFGAVVDGIEEILSLNNDSKLKIPEVLFEGNQMGALIKEAFQVKNENNGELKTVLVIGLEYIYQSYFSKPTLIAV